MLLLFHVSPPLTGISAVMNKIRKLPVITVIVTLDEDLVTALTCLITAEA